MSVYLWCSEGLSTRNLDLLQTVAGALVELNGQWLIAGDFNMPPDVLRQSGWLNVVRGAIHAPDAPTCNGKTYDFFVSSVCLAPAMKEVLVVADAGTSPHVPVRSSLFA